MKKRVMKAAGAGVLSLGLVFGLAGLAGATTGTIGTTGPDSENEISEEHKVEMDFDNHNDVDLHNGNMQKASSGEAEVEDNTTGGDAATGDARNTNSTAATVEIDNSEGSSAFAGVATSGGSNSGTINNTGPDSENEIEYESKIEVEVDNNNDVYIKNHNYQSAYSGDAEVDGNTTGGDAETGDAVNTNSSSFTVRITN